jgi:hypothetical protein
LFQLASFIFSDAGYETVSRKGAKAQSKSAVDKFSLRLCAFAPLRES